MAAKVYPLSQNEAAFGGHTVKCSINSTSDFSSTAGTSATISLLTLGAGHVIRGVAYKVAQDLTGASLTTATLSIGINGTTNTWINAANIGTTSILTYGVSNTVLGINTTSTVSAHLITTGCNHTALTAGKIDVFIDVVDLSKAE
jgi:hypothetical protein